jgi:hypothetical protein
LQCSEQAIAWAPVLAAGALVININAMAHADVNDFIEDVDGELGVSNFVTGDSGPGRTWPKSATLDLYACPR